LDMGINANAPSVISQSENHTQAALFEYMQAPWVLMGER